MEEFEGPLSVVKRAGKTVGVLAASEAEEPRVVDALRSAGYEVVPQGAVIDLEGECDEDPAQEASVPQPCDIRVGVAYARDLAADAGVDAPEVQDLLEKRWVTVEEVEAAITTLQNRLPEELRTEAGAIVEYIKHPRG